MKELKLFCLFPTTVGHFSEAIKLTEAEKNYIQKQQTRLNLGGGGNEHTVDTYVLDKEELKNIKKSLMECVKVYAEQAIKFDDKKAELYITQSWLNFNKKNTHHHPHYHPNSILSGVVYLSENSEHTKLQRFISNRKNVIVLPKKELGIINSESFLIETSYGSCVIFPSTLMHSVLPNTTDEVRITLSFNVFVKGEMQGDDLSKLTI